MTAGPAPALRSSRASYVDHWLRPPSCCSVVSVRSLPFTYRNRRDVGERLKREAAVELRAGVRGRKRSGCGRVGAELARATGRSGQRNSRLRPRPPASKASPDKPPGLYAPFARASRVIVTRRAPRASVRRDFAALVHPPGHYLLLEPRPPPGRRCPLGRRVWILGPPPIASYKRPTAQAAA